MSLYSTFKGLDTPTLDHLATRRDAVKAGSRVAGALAMASIPAALAFTAKNLHASAVPAAAIPVLNFALTLEYLEAEFYVLGVESGVIPDRDLGIFVTIRDHEVAHVEFLKAALGADAVAKPTFDFTAGGAFNPFGDYPTFKILAQGFEDTGVRAYKGQLPALQPFDALLTAAATIHSVEGRHASRVRRLRGEEGWIPFNDPAAPAALAATYAGEENLLQLGIAVGAFEGAEAGTEAFDEPLTMAEVLAIVAPFLA